MVAYAVTGHDSSRKPVVMLKTLHTGHRKIWASLGIDGGVGPIRHSVRSHTPGESQHAAQYLGSLRRRVPIIRSHREQMHAGNLGGGKLRVADAELLGGRELSVAGGIGEVVHAVGSHALGKQKRARRSGDAAPV